MEIQYTFIHPTKCGGTSCELFFKEHYSNYITGFSHGNLCTNDNNPIIIIRDVYTRFFSMFKYWKYGSIDTKNKRNTNFTIINKDKNIIDFINLLKNKDYKNLIYDFTWDIHFKSTSHWINNTDYKNIIVIIYNKDLNESIQKLLNLLNIPNKNIALPHKTISKAKKKDVEFFKNNIRYISNFINEYFKDDIELIHNIQTYPEKFKLVI